MFFSLGHTVLRWTPCAALTNLWCPVSACICLELQTFPDSLGMSPLWPCCSWEPDPLSLKTYRPNCTAFISKMLVYSSWFNVSIPDAFKSYRCTPKLVCDVLEYRRRDERDIWSGNPKLYLSSCRHNLMHKKYCSYSAEGLAYLDCLLRLANGPSAASDKGVSWPCLWE